MNSSEARSQFKRSLKIQLESFIGLMNRDWPEMREDDRTSLNTNSMKALKLFSQAPENVDAILSEYPLFLF